MHDHPGEPFQQDVERLVTDEERRLLNDPDVPEESKEEILERLDRFRDADDAASRAEDAGNE